MNNGAVGYFHSLTLAPIIEMMSQLHSDLRTNGWIEIDNISSDIDLVNISKEIGKIIPQQNGELIYKLTPSNGKSSVKGTFSNRYGFNSFPLHTDTAFWTVPVRYILLSSLYRSDCNTVLTSASSILNLLELKDRENAQRAIFKIKTTQSQFYSSLIFNERNDTGIKYDSACMFPANNFAKSFVQKLSESRIPVNEIKWKGNNAIIIDNWKMLHGRGAALIDEKRELKRIYIN
jgi:alpha-ketoglutarate-dependent taurine dioxygenase